MRKSVWIERLPGGYSVRYWQEVAPGVFRQPREWFEDHNLAQKFAATKKLQLLAKQQGVIDPTLKPNDLFQSYLQSLKLTHRPETIELKHQALKRYFEEHKLLSLETIKAWKLKMAQTYHINTIHIRLREMRVFCNWCVKEQHLQESPFKGVEIPPGQEVGRKLEINEVKRILEASDVTFKPYLLFLIYTGGRRTEIIKTTWSDLDLEKGVWFVPAANSKSKKDRYVPLNPSLTELLKCLPRPSARVFDGWTTNTPHWYLKKAQTKAGVIGRVRVHDFRHTFASHWSGDPRILMDMLGWTSSAMIKRYSHFNLENVRQEATAKGIGAKLVEGPAL